jgi:proteasome maturation protein
LQLQSNIPKKKMEQHGLPVYSGPVDHLRFGFRSLENELSAPHPIQALQKTNNNAWLAKLDQVRRTHGSHMAMRLATERETFSRVHRLPGLESSNIALQTLMGTADTIEFPDFLNSKFIFAQVPS